MTTSPTFDENLFFREATRHICGNLNIEESLYDFLLYAQTFIPMDAIFVNFLDRPASVILIHAVADSSGGRVLDLQVPIPAGMEWLKTDLERVSNPGIFSNTHEDALTRQYAISLGFPESSMLFSLLRLDGRPVGSIQSLAKGTGRYRPEHLCRLLLLNDPLAIALMNSRHHRQLIENKNRLEDDNRYFQQELSQMSGETIVGINGGLKQVADLARQVAKTNSPVLLFGETGTGKEVVARAIHNWSERRTGPFIKVNCGAIPDSLMDSDLFGHEKGAFTGATALKRGRFERAHKGTILLDEVSELTQEAQVRLLRVLQEKEIERVGGTETIRIDIRVIAASNRDLKAMVASGLFRKDLYYRLDVFPLTIPPLRNRKGDMEELVRYFSQKKAAEMGWHKPPQIQPEALALLKSYDWPGNVRELEHLIERAMIITRKREIDFADILPHSPSLPDHSGSASASIQAGGEILTLDEAMAAHINKVMTLTHGRVEGVHGAARRLNVKSGKLRYQMRRLGIAFGRQTRG